MEEPKKPTIEWIYDEYKKVIDGNTAAGAIALGILRQFVPQTDDMVQKEDELLRSITEINQKGAVLLGVLTGAVKYLEDENTALLSDLSDFADCELCKYMREEEPEDCQEHCSDCQKNCCCAGCVLGSKWEWRGIQN